MPGSDRPSSPSRALRGRGSECEVLVRLLDELRAGHSSVLVLRGDPGIGKTALLDFMADAAADLTVARAGGVESEMELTFAALHQICGPMLHRMERLPRPQYDALATAFGLTSGPAPDRFLVGLAVLSLMSEVAEELPLVCLIDDAHWLDRASAQALAFAARRLLAEPVLLVFATREPGADYTGLPELTVEGLPDADARDLLNSVLPWPLDEQVRERILAETHGNPLALLELPRGHSPSELTGGFGVPDPLPLSGRIEQSFEHQLAALPTQTRRLMQLAAADPVGDQALLWRAAAKLRIPASAAAPAADAGLLDLGAHVRFRHPLVRSAAYRSASLQERQDAHRALADVTDPQTDPDRRAWHRANASSGPDEEVAAELERCAGRALSRGGLAAAAAFLERATTLTANRARQAERALAAAHAKIQAGAFDAAQKLVAIAELLPLDQLQLMRADLIRAKLAFAAQRSGDAAGLLLKAAHRLEQSDLESARTTYLDAMSAAMYSTRLACPEGSLSAVAQAVRAAPPGSRPQRAPDLLLDGLAANLAEGYSAGLPLLRGALSTSAGEMCVETELRWLALAGIAAVHVWDAERWAELSAQRVEVARSVGALSELPLALSMRVQLLFVAGELTAAESLIDEIQATTAATGSTQTPFSALGLAAIQGREGDLAVLVESTLKEVTPRGEGIGITATEWATALLYNGLGRYDAALAAAEQGSRHLDDLGFGPWCLPELIEAAARAGATAQAADALRRLSEMTTASGTDWALGMEARSRALLSEGEGADRLYQEAIQRLARTRMRTELARAHLVYGEWLRRENRRVDAREQLRTAHEMLTAMGAQGFADRARRELLATGETVRKRSRTVESARDLTTQEVLIARLARDGLSTPEISTQLFISPRTVEWHLRNVFTKLGINSRRQLRAATLRPAARSVLSS
ncbi:MAG TPA: AAA family ATPase [Kribbella sp.]|uniref:helix-turn-helix transcriptional regulator n=1 Tax=Kribbella sp. TaxID=1871183 RepID=UPI002D786286|nr:AAA family ATPase [Kribbella sp.]HET6297162.1 AAA family ATPase [Kribbella sp.]